MGGRKELSFLSLCPFWILSQPQYHSLSISESTFSERMNDRIEQNVVPGGLAEEEPKPLRASSRLYEDLKNGYNKYFRPLKDQMQPVKIKFGFALNQLIEVVSMSRFSNVSVTLLKHDLEV